MTTAIVDYGSGNLHSAEKAVVRAARDFGLSETVTVTADPHAIAAADRIILPGVGAFADCKAGLLAIDGMAEALGEAVRVNGRPLLGICVGMQLMATRGLEKTETAGFDWIPGDVGRIAPTDPALKVPHMGWNTIDAGADIHPVLEGIEIGPGGLHAYFVHSFHHKPVSPDDRIATADYGGPVTAMIARDTVVGTQFHPEKSQRLGLLLLANFLRWAP
ncbi:MAG: imidazole glycerol phosphate synthase subunit HisH [Pseudomonadota bacterium]